MDVQRGFFKLTMKSNFGQAMVEAMALTSNKANPIIMNLLTCMWCVIHAFQLLSHSFSKYLKLVEIDMVHVLNFIEDERCFNFISFLKNKVHNYLNAHLQMVVAMYSHKFFTLDTFSYEIAYDMWSNV